MTLPFLTAPKDGYVFIVTYGRSGSTLLQNVLNAIPGYCIRGENNNALYHLARSWDAVAREPGMTGLRTKGAPTEPTHPWYGAEAVIPRDYARVMANAFVREVLHPPKGTRVAGFKEIRFHSDAKFFPRYLNFIRWHFPNTRFIFNTRDHAGVAKSGWWAKKDAAQVTQQLQAAEKLFDAYAQGLPDKCLRLHYDDYTGNPDGLKPLFDFLGEPFDHDRVAAVLERRLDHLKTPAP